MKKRLLATGLALAAFAAANSADAGWVPPGTEGTTRDGAWACVSRKAHAAMSDAGGVMAMFDSKACFLLEGGRAAKLLAYHFDPVFVIEFEVTTPEGRQLVLFGDAPLEF